jgi:hypothetical protein
VTHTTLPPKVKAVSGLALKPYLGRLYYIAQLNAALLTVARREGLEVVDYEQVGASGGCGAGDEQASRLHDGVARTARGVRKRVLRRHNIPAPLRPSLSPAYCADWRALHGQPDLPG